MSQMVDALEKAGVISSDIANRAKSDLRAKKEKEERKKAYADKIERQKLKNNGEENE